MQCRRTVCVVAGLVASAGSVCRAEPSASLVSFAWSLSGSANPGAGAICNAGCDNTSACDAVPNSFSASGNALAQFFNNYQGSRSCFGVCGGLAIGTGYGQINADVSIADPLFDGVNTRWIWAGSVASQSGASGGDRVCGHSFGTGQAGGSQTADLVFDVDYGSPSGPIPGANVTLLTINYTHYAANEGSASSTWTLQRLSGPVIASDSVNNALGNSTHNGSFAQGLAPGRYQFHSTYSASGGVSSSDGTSPTANSSAGANFELHVKPYTCAGLTAGPGSAAICSGQSATFDIISVGTETVTQWSMEDPTASGEWLNLSDGPLTIDGTVWGMLSGTSTATLLATPDPLTYAVAPTLHLRCIVSNACNGVTSDSVTLTVHEPSDPACCPCPADFDASGGTPDATDIDAFFIAWLIGEATADADCSGGTPDSSDIDAFFTAWLNGGC